MFFNLVCKLHGYKSKIYLRILELNSQGKVEGIRKEKKENHGIFVAECKWNFPSFLNYCNPYLSLLLGFY